MAEVKYPYHFSGSRTNTNLDEPLWLSKYKITYVLPVILQQKFGQEQLVSQMKDLKGLNLDKLPPVSKQMYRGNPRSFIGTVVDTSVTITSTFEVNVDQNGIVYPYNILRAWCKIAWDARTAMQMLKRDYVGKATIEIHNKIGQILRQVYIPILFPIDPPAAWDLDFNANNNYSLNTKWVVENPKDDVNGE